MVLSSWVLPWRIPGGGDDILATHSFMQQFMIELFASPKLPVRGRTGWESAEIAFQRRKQLMSPHIRISEWLD